MLLPFFAGCQNQTKKLSTKELTITNADNSSITLIAEIAKTDEERAQGLMYRKELAEGEAMLFVFDRDQMMNFWMKNTFIPLSIAYISSDGIILEIHDMKPHVEAPVSSARSARYALEVPQGWFTSAGVNIGDKLIY
jgi:uncharacterized membrane protein (UPF0127 family)